MPNHQSTLTDEPISDTAPWPVVTPDRTARSQTPFIERLRKHVKNPMFSYEGETRVVINKWRGDPAETGPIAAATFSPVTDPGDSEYDEDRSKALTACCQLFEKLTGATELPSFAGEHEQPSYQTFNEIITGPKSRSAYENAQLGRELVEYGARVPTGVELDSLRNDTICLLVYPDGRVETRSGGAEARTGVWKVGTDDESGLPEREPVALSSPRGHVKRPVEDNTSATSPTWKRPYYGTWHRDMLDQNDPGRLVSSTWTTSGAELELLEVQRLARGLRGDAPDHVSTGCHSPMQTFYEVQPVRELKTQVPRHAGRTRGRDASRDEAEPSRNSFGKLPASSPTAGAGGSTGEQPTQGPTQVDRNVFLRQSMSSFAARHGSLSRLQNARGPAGDSNQIPVGNSSVQQVIDIASAFKQLLGESPVPTGQNQKRSLTQQELNGVRSSVGGLRESVTRAYPNTPTGTFFAEKAVQGDEIVWEKKSHQSQNEEETETSTQVPEHEDGVPEAEEGDVTMEELEARAERRRAQHVPFGRRLCDASQRYLTDHSLDTSEVSVLVTLYQGAEDMVATFQPIPSGSEGPEEDRTVLARQASSLLYSSMSALGSPVTKMLRACGMSPAFQKLVEGAVSSAIGENPRGAQNITIVENTLPMPTDQEMRDMRSSTIGVRMSADGYRAVHLWDRGELAKQRIGTWEP